MTEEKQIMRDERKWDKIMVLQDIAKNYEHLEKSIVKQLFFALHNHGSTIGSFREDIWASLFEQIVPKKFKIEKSVFIIDSKCGEACSKDGISKEVDIAIVDESYTPYIFQYGRIKFIPIEAVAAIIECKSTDRLSKGGEGKYLLEEWLESINKLKTAKDSIARMAVSLSVEPPLTQTATRPITINCYLSTKKKSGKSDQLDDLFDIVLKADETLGKINIKCKSANLGNWFKMLNFAEVSDENIDINLYKEFKKKDDENYQTVFNNAMERKLGHYRVKEEGDIEGQKEISLLSFNFMLNQLLMLINNPLLFPHKSYVDMFKEVLPLPKENERT